MLQRLRSLFGRVTDSGWPSIEYEPVYGLPRREVEAWLARNPHLRKEYEVEEWLVRNPPLRAETEAARKQRILAMRA